MRKLLGLVLSIAAVCCSARGQGVSGAKPGLGQGLVLHQGATATVETNSTRPLDAAITAVREEYGWAVSFEDPPYSGSYDLRQVTSTIHRAGRIITRTGPAIKGGPFASTYAATPSLWSSPAAEQEVLEKIVSEYNSSGNPGGFVVRQLPNGSFDVVGDIVHDDAGRPVAVTPVLDIPVSVPGAGQDIFTTLKAILHALSLKTGIQMGIALAPSTFPGRSVLSVGGASSPARDLIMRLLDSLGGKYVWRLIYEPESREYLLGIYPVVRAEYDTFGQKRLVPVGPNPAPGP